MKNDLTCGVTADLLPSYVERLTSAETDRAVEAHVASCPDCAAKLAAMRGPETETAIDVVPEVDYLKKVKKRTGRKVVLAVLCTIAVIVLGIVAKVFVIGESADPEGLAVQTQELRQNNILRLDITTPWSGTAYHSWKVETNEGVVNIRARQVLVNPLFSGGSAQLDIPMDGVKEIYLCGRLIWQDGMVISPKTLALLEAKTPYLGDAPSVGNIAALLGVQSQVGSYTMELGTSKEPFFWKFNFSDTLPLVQDERMTGLAYQMLALVGNLDEVHWTGGRSISLSQVNRAMEHLTEEYNKAHGTFWKAKSSVRDYTVSPADYQQFVAVLSDYFGTI